MQLSDSGWELPALCPSRGQADASEPDNGSDQLHSRLPRYYYAIGTDDDHLLRRSADLHQSSSRAIREHYGDRDGAVGRFE